MQQADHEVAYELRKAFDKFKALRQEMRSRGFRVQHPMKRLDPILPGSFHNYRDDEDNIEIHKSTTVTY